MLVNLTRDGLNTGKHWLSVKENKETHTHKFLAIFPLNASNLVTLLRGSCHSEEIYLVKQPTLLLYYDGYQILTGRNTQVHCIVIDAVFKKSLHDVLYT